MRTLVGTLVTLAALASLAAPTAVLAEMPPAPSLNLKLADQEIVTRDYCLPSGLRISFQEDHSQPIVAVTLVIDRGSDADPRGLEGLAHLIEHLNFRSVHAPRPSTWDFLDEMGANTNAFTGADETAYMTIVGKDYLVPVLQLEALRLTDAIEGVTEEMLLTEREVVRNELRSRVENSGEGQLSYLFDKLYPEDHPYHYMTIGNHTSLSNITLDDAREFVEKNYIPENSTLMVVGDFSLDQTWDFVVQSFPVELLVTDPEDIEQSMAELQQAQCPVRISGPSDEPPDPVTQELTFHKAGVSSEKLVVAWSLPGAYRPNEPLMSLTSSLLTYFVGTYLPKATMPWIQDEANRVSCGLWPNELASTALCEIQLWDGEDPQKILDKAINGLYQLWDVQNREVLKKEFVRYRSITMAGMLESVEEVSSLFGTRATQTALFTHFTGDAAFFSRNIEWLAGVEAHDAAQFAEKYLNRKRYTAVVLEPWEEGDVALDSSENQYTGHPREPAANTAMDLGKVDTQYIKDHMVLPDLSQMRTFTLSNGLQVVLLPYGADLIARTALVFRGGPLIEPEPGLDAAASHYTNYYPDKPGLTLQTDPILIVGDWDNYPLEAHKVLSLSGSAGNLDAQIYLLRSLLENMQVENVGDKTYMREQLAALRSDRGSVTYWEELVRLRALFPDHPLSRLLSFSPGWPLPYVLDEDTIARIHDYTVTDLESWNRQVFQPANGTLFIVGRMNLDQAEQWVRQYFDDWQVPSASGHPMPDAPPPPEPGEQKLFVLDDPNVTQTTVSLMCQIQPGTEENYEARQMMASLLDELLFTTLRESLGLTYGAWAYQADHSGDTTELVMGTDVQNDSAALTAKVFLDATRRAAEGDLDPDLLKLMKLRETRKYVLNQQTTQQMLDRITAPARYGFSWNFIEGHADRLAAVSISDIQALMGPCVGHEVLTLVGPEAVIVPQLEEQGIPYQVFDWEAESDRLYKEYDPKGWAKEQKKKQKKESKEEGKES